MKPGAAGGRKRESIQEKGPGPTSHRRWDLGRALSLREASLTSTHWRLEYTTQIIFFSSWPCRAACGILVPGPGIEPVPSAVKTQSPNHWTARELVITQI